MDWIGVFPKSPSKVRCWAGVCCLLSDTTTHKNLMSRRNEDKGWKTVESRSRVAHAAKPLAPRFDVIAFLRSHKTSECPHINQYHDHRLCRYFHNENDRRRSPYKTYYLPEESLNSVEKIFHPHVFRTKQCPARSCPYGDVCAFAHSNKNLREPHVAEIEYSACCPVNTRALPQLNKFVGLDRPRDLPSANSANAPWKSALEQNRMFVTQELVPLERSSREWFLLNSSSEFFSFLQSEVSKEGLCTVEKVGGTWTKEKHPGVLVRGVFVEDAVARIASFLIEPPDEFFVVETKQLSERVIRIIAKTLKEQGQRALVGRFDSSAFVQAQNRSIIVTSVNKRDLSRAAVELVLGKVEFWIKEAGYDKFHTCNACMEECNTDQGITCSKGHFWCAVGDDAFSEGTCFSSMVTGQLPQIQSQNGFILCPICSLPFNDTSQVAKNLPEGVWTEFQDAVVDMKASSRVEQLSHEFDLRLEEKIEEFMNHYGTLQGAIKERAKICAKKARDDVLNLKCPHPRCRAPYAEFDGCMALKCATCQKSFCGYCHKGTEDSRSAHDHVRSCDMNETLNGSYYADPEQIKTAHRKYRIKELKRFLQQYKKDVRNATIIELQRDLDDLGIHRAALFEFGNLQFPDEE